MNAKGKKTELNFLSIRLSNIIIKLEQKSNWKPVFNQNLTEIRIDEIHG